jgi:hypothetical protein
VLDKGREDLGENFVRVVFTTGEVYNEGEFLFLASGRGGSLVGCFGCYCFPKEILARVLGGFACIRQMRSGVRVFSFWPFFVD